MKKKSIKLLIMSLVLTMGTTLAVGCSSKSGDTATKETTKTEAKKAEELEVFKTSDNLHEISVPKSEKWTDTKQPGEIITLQKQNSGGTRALVITSEGKEKFSKDITLKEYSDLVIQGMKLSVPTLTKKEYKDVTINNMKGLQFEASAEVNKVKLTYLITVVDDGKSFNKVSVLASAEDFEKSKSALEKITNSFK